VKRVMIGGMMHETNTFNPFLTSLDNFKRKELLYNDEIIVKRQNTNTELGGFIKFLENQKIDIVPSVFGSALPSGPVTSQAFDTILSAMLDTLKRNQVDGILLALHGAMVTETCDDGEGFILSSIREVTGRDIPIVITLDFHAVLTPLITSLADAIIIYRTYPHIDQAERGYEAASIMSRILKGEIHPVVALSKQPLLIMPPHNVLPGDMPMKQIIDRARQMERDVPGVITACPSQGFVQQDVPFAGTGIVVTTDNNLELAQTLADELGEMMFSHRRDFFVDLPDPAEAVSSAARSENPPVAIADSGDNIGAGTPGDGTMLLSEIIKQRIDSASVQLCDPEAASTAAKAGIGSTITLAVGGKSDPVYGPPVEITGTVRTLTDGVYLNREWGGYQAGVVDNMGLSARIDCGGITIVVTSLPVCPNNIMHANSIGVYPEDYRMTVCKGGLAFREAYKPPRANSYIQSDTPGYSSPNLRNFTFIKITRPIYPLDNI